MLACIDVIFLRIHIIESIMLPVGQNTEDGHYIPHI